MPSPLSDPAAAEAEPTPPAVFERLHPNARLLLRLTTMLGIALPFAGATAVLALIAATELDVARSQLLLAAVAGSLLLSLPAGWAYGGLRYRHVRYRLDASGLEIHRGVLWRTETRIPRSRVQHTDINRGPLDRRLGLASLRVFTAGTRLASVDLDGLDAARATELRDALLDGHDDAV